MQAIAYVVEESELRYGSKFGSRGAVGTNVEGGRGSTTTMKTTLARNINSILV